MRISRRPRRLVLVLMSTAAAIVFSLQMASGAQAAAFWKLSVISDTKAAPGAQHDFLLQPQNFGADATDGTTPYTLEASLPVGLSAVSVTQFDEGGWTCDDGAGNPVGSGDVQAVRCERTDSFNGDGGLQNLLLRTAVAPGAAGPLTTEFSLSGGQASGGGAMPSASRLETVYAQADDAVFGLEGFDGHVAASASGDPYTQAAGTPFTVSTSIDFTTEFDPRRIPFPGLEHVAIGTSVDDARDIVVDLPPGLVGGTAGLARCSLADLSAARTISGPVDCSSASQVGVTSLRTPGFVELPDTPVFNMEPPPGAPARFGFFVLGVVVVLDAEVRSNGDYGITVDARNISQGLVLAGTDMTFWGVPADPAHDIRRFCTGREVPVTEPQSVLDSGCVDAGGDPLYERPPLARFLRLPTSCVGPVETTAYIDSWQNPAPRTADGRPDLSDPRWLIESFTSHNPPGHPLPESEWGSPQGVTGCQQVPFNPQINVDTTSNEADSPTGLEVDISIPQNSNPNVLGSSDLKDTVVTLPEGFTLNPSSADGLEACTLEEIDLDGLNTEPDCPNASKIGTTTIDTPLLDDPLEGSVFLAEPDDPNSPGAENPFDTLVAYYIVAEGPGTVIKLPGKVELDQDTGQITNTFTDNPQLPFSNFHVEFFDGPRSPLATPRTCGTGQVSTELTPWARPSSPVTRTVDLDVTSGSNGLPCPAGLAGRPFGPSLSAGLVSPVAGSTSPFVLRLTRPDGHQELSSMEVTAPEGLSAFLKGIPVCSDAQANAGSCPVASKVGRAISGAGAGPAPFYVPEGSVFLTGPYKGAPLGMLVQVRAVAGPFDLGVVNVRAAVHVDRRTAQVRVVSDPLPQILKGIPLRIRDVRVVLDREGFTVAPTDCSEKRVLATVHGSHGGIANLSNRFQVGDCASLGFSPRLGLALKGRRQVRTGGHPAVRAVVRQGSGQAAIRAARVVLPKSLALDPDNAQALCEFVDGTKPDLENHCPDGSIVGRARAHTPLLDRPLVGNVYFVKNVRIDPDTGNEIRTLPMIVTALRGQIQINLVGESSTTKAGRLVNTFAGVPDAPIRRFNLNIKGGRNGILAVTRTRQSTINLCRRPGSHRASTGWRGHNGKLSRYRVRVKTPCRSARRKRQLRLRRAAAKRRATARRNR